MPTYIIYTLQHVIHLAKQIKLQTESQWQRNFDYVIKKLDEVQDLINEWCVSIKVPKNVQMSSLIVEEEDSREMSEEKVQFVFDWKFQPNNLCQNMHDVSLDNKISIDDDDVVDLYEIFNEKEQPTLEYDWSC